jgi:hypothetical protein
VFYGVVRFAEFVSDALQGTAVTELEVGEERAIGAGGFAG